MDINKFYKLIVNKDAKEFKKYFETSVVNSHHRELLLDLCFKSKDIELIDFMFKRSNPSEKTLVDFLEYIFKEGDEQIKYTVFFESLKDADLINVHRDFFKNLATKNEDVFMWFLQKFPMTAIKNFKHIALGAMLNGKEDLIKKFYEVNFDCNTCHSICVYAYQLEKTDIALNFLGSQAKRNFNTLTELQKKHKEISKVQKDQYNWWIGLSNSPFYASVQKKLNKIEDLNKYMDDLIKKVFVIYLDKKADKAEEESPRRKNKI